ncbi:hypothetical protein KJ742_01630 [Patescibacteria group bacterium]|nr:hypothetical protein [Patescibacteria group bacterium]MBU1682624.1 hypothetical protein [Patescibacteria group bacterium]
MKKILSIIIGLLIAVNCQLLNVNCIIADDFVPSDEDENSSNTFILDADNSGGDITLQFGASLGEYLEWNSSGLNFDFSDETLVLDASNTGAGANVDIVANQGSDNDGTLRYNATANQWEYSNDGGAFTAIGSGASGDLDDAYDNDADKKLDIDNASGLEFESTSTANTIFDLQNTGDLVIQDGGITFFEFNDSGQVTYTLGAGNTLTLDAKTTDHTGLNAMEINVDANSANVTGLSIDGDVGTALSAGEYLTGLNINVAGLAGDDAGSGLNGIELYGDTTTPGTVVGINMANNFDVGLNLAGTFGTAISSSSGNWNATLGATEGININASSTGHTGSPVIGVDMHSDSATIQGISVDADVATELSAGESMIAYEANIAGLAGDDATSNLIGFLLNGDPTTGGNVYGLMMNGNYDTAIQTAEGDWIANLGATDQVNINGSTVTRTGNMPAFNLSANIDTTAAGDDVTASYTNVTRAAADGGRTFAQNISLNNDSIGEGYGLMVNIDQDNSVSTNQNIGITSYVTGNGDNSLIGGNFSASSSHATTGENAMGMAVSGSSSSTQGTGMGILAQGQSAGDTAAALGGYFMANNSGAGFSLGVHGVAIDDANADVISVAGAFLEIQDVDSQQSAAIAALAGSSAGSGIPTDYGLIVLDNPNPEYSVEGFTNGIGLVPTTMTTGILIQPPSGSTYTTGIDIDNSQGGAVTTGMQIDAGTTAILADSGDVIVDEDVIVGGSTSRTETIDDGSFGLGGDDLFVAGMAGVEGDLYVDGGEFYLTGTASSASTTEGTIYYDTDDDNLYVYANGGWVDLTNSAAGTDLTGLGTDNTIARWNGANTLQDSGLVIDDNDNLTGIGTTLSVNSGAIAADNVDSGITLTTGDGTNIENWMILNDESAKNLVFRYKEDPTDPTDLTEAGYTDYLTITDNGASTTRLETQAGLSIAPTDSLSFDVGGANDYTFFTGNTNQADLAKTNFDHNLYTGTADNQYGIRLRTDVATALSAGIHKGGMLIDFDGNALDNATSEADALKIIQTTETGGIGTGIRIDATTFDYGMYIADANTAAILVDGGSTIFDETSTEAFLIRKDGDAGDVFVVDTTNTEVGIGVTNPNAILQTYQNSAGSHVTGLQITNANTTNGTGAQIDFNLSGDNTYIGASVGAERVDSEGDGELYFMTREDPGTGNLERMRIDRFGKVGINVTDPGAKFETEVSDGDNVPGVLVDNNDVTNDTEGVQISMSEGGGAPLLIDPLSTAPNTTDEGSIYYDSDDDNLYVYANGSWVDLTAVGGGGGGWTDDGTLVRLDTSTDNVTIGSALNLAKLAVDGDTDEAQMIVQGHSTQTADFFVVEESDGNNIFNINQYGAIDLRPIGEDDAFHIDGGYIDAKNLLRLKSFNEENDSSDPGIFNIEHDRSSGMTGDLTAMHVDMITTQSGSGYNLTGLDVIMNNDANSVGLRLDDIATEIQFLDTAATITTADTGTLSFGDGTNTFLSLADQGTSAIFTLNGDQIIDNTSSEAFLVRKDADAGDVFIVDTTNSRVGIGVAPTVALDVNGGARIGDSTNNAAFGTDGTLTLNGTAEVTKRDSIYPEGITLVGAGAATFYLYGEAPEIEYSNGVIDDSNFTWTVPTDFKAGSDVNIILVWSGSAGSDGQDVYWGLDWEFHAATEAPSGALANTSNSTADVGTPFVANGIAPLTTNFTLTGGVTDDALIARLHRLGAHANDTVTGTADLYAIIIEYTADKLGE